MQLKTASIASHSATAVGVLAIGLLLTAAASYRAATEVAWDAKAKFELAVATAEDDIERRIQANTDILYGVRGLFSGSESVSRDAFRRYVSSLDLEQRYPGIQAVTFVRRVPFGRKHDYEVAVRRDTSVDPNGYPNFTIRPPGDRPEYFVVEYLEPMAGNEAGFGLDTGGEPVRLASVERARDSGLLTATGPVTLLERGGTGYLGVVMRLPIYRNGMPRQTVEQRRAAMIGLVAATYRMDHLMHKALSEQLLRQFHIRIHDAGSFNSNLPSEPPTAENLLFDNGQLLDSGSAQPGLLAAIAGAAALTKTLAFDVSGRRWHVYISARQEFGNLSDRWLPIGVLFGGISISLLLFGLIRSLATVSSRATTLAASITGDLRRSEASLAKAQRQTQELIEALPNPIYFKATDGRYLGVNRAWEKFFGTSRNTFIGKTVHDLYPNDPEVARRLHADDQLLWDHPGTTTYETIITTPGGQRHDVVYYKATFTHTDGSVAGLIGTIVDISERKALERQFEDTFEQAAVGIAHIGLDEETLRVNRKFCDITGYAAGELVGKPISFLSFAADHRSGASGRKALLEGRLGSHSNEKRYVRKDGSVIWVNRTESLARDETGTAAYFIRVIEDISERKQAEAARTQLAAIVENSNDAMISRTVDGTIFTWNKGAEQLFGYTAQEMIGANTMALMPPDRVAEAIHNRDYLQQGNALSGYETVRVTKDGRRLAVSVNSSPIKDAAGNVTSVASVFHDITARKQADEIRARLAAIVDGSNDAIISRSLDLKVMSWNAAAERLFGYSAAEAIGQDIYALIVPPDRDAEAEGNRAQLTQEHAVLDFETVRRTKDGRLIDVSLSQSPIIDEHGAMTGVALIFRDIRERKQVETARVQLAAIVENSNDAIFSRTLDGTILSWNPGAEKMLGYTAAEVIGKSVAITLPPNRPPNLAQNNEALIRGEMIARESNRMTKDGRVIDVMTSHSPIRDAVGNIVGASMILQDITALKQARAAAKASEERFRATFDQAAVGIVHTSYEGNYLLVNQKFCDMLGYREYELVGRAAVDFTHPDDRESGRQYRQRIWEGKLAGFTEEKRYLRKDGGVIWTNRTVSLARDASGKPLYFIRVIEDITARKEAEERYRATFENAPVGIMHTAIDGYRILRANRKLCEMLGYTREELLGMTSTDIVHPDYQFSDRINYRQPILDGARQAFASERQFVRKDGSSLWVNRTVSVVKNAAGEPLYFIRIVEDITDRKQAETALRDSELRYRLVIAAIAEGVVLRDQDARIVTCNASAERILGKTLDQMQGSMFYDTSWQAIREDGTPFPLEERPIRVALRTGQLQSNVVQGLRKPDGTVLWLSMNVQPLFDDSDGRLTGIVSTLTDITERKQSELRQTMEHAVTRILAEAETLADAAPRIIQTICETMKWHCGARWQMDQQAGVLRCIECWGVDTPEIREFMAANSQRAVDPQSPSGRGLVRRIYNTGQTLWIADIVQEPGFLRAPMVLKAGLHGAFGFPLLLGTEVLGLMEFFHRDVREPDTLLLRIADSIGNQIGQFMARKQAEERIRHLANYDELTGLPNRSMFQERLHHALAQAQRHARPLAVLFIDLDRFKNINDTLGHEAGDRVLREVAERLRACLRDSDTVGRLGGDEFVVLLEGLPQPADVAAVAQKILDAAARPFILAAQEFRIGASIGISTFPDDGKDMQNLLKNADAAMYRAKERGRNNYQFYSTPPDVRLVSA